LLLEKLAHQPQRGAHAASALNQHLKDLALTADSTPEVAELQHPAPHRFIGDIAPTLGERILHVSIAQGEAEIEPDRVLNDLGWKTTTAIAEQNLAATLTYPNHLRPTRWRD
jgi:hypothetical protein